MLFLYTVIWRIALENKEVMYHIKLSKNDLEGAFFAILTGDPGRVERIANFLNNSKKIGESREYVSFLGEISGKKILIISTGIGGPSTAICVEELAQIGVTHFIRVGTSGGMALKVNAGDIVIATGAVRQEGTSREYLPIEFPAVADLDISFALRSTAKELNISHHVGVVHCKDSFYGQHSPKRMGVSYELCNKWSAWLKGGTLCSEMESAALFTIANNLNLHAGTVLLVIWNQEREKTGLSQNQCFDIDRAVKVAIGAIRKLVT